MCRKAKIEKIFQNIYKREAFELVVQKVKLLSASEGKCTASFTVEKEHISPSGDLHGGFSASLTDIYTNMVLQTYKNNENIFVTVSYNILFLKAAPIGTEVLLDAKVLNGNKLAFVNIDLYNKSNNDLLAKSEIVARMINKNLMKTLNIDQ